MKRKTSTTPSRIYTYGLPFGPDEDCREAVDEQIRLARVYQNNLIEIELARRGAVRAVMTEMGLSDVEERIESLVSERDALRAKIKADRAKTRKRSSALAADRERVGDLNRSIKKARQERKDLRAKLRTDPEVKRQFDQINERVNDMVRRHRAVCGVFWGTYLLIENAANQQRRSKMDPRFRRWDGSGRVGVQIQKGMSVAELMSGNDRRLQIDPVPEDTYTSRRGERRRKSRTKVRLRIGSTGRDPIWASFRVIMHRPLPEDARIMWAWAKRRRVGTRWRWVLQLSIESETFRAAPKKTGSVAAIDIGWRHRGEDGFRVGYLVDEDGKGKELLLPKRVVERIEYANTLRSIRDQNFELARAELCGWLAAPAVPPPAWLSKALERLSQWRSTARLSKVAWRWRHERFDGDDDIFECIDQWRQQDRHLYKWEASQRSKSLGHRREFYRLMATEIARKHRKLVIEDFDLRKMAALAPVESESGNKAAQRRQRVMCALSEFRAALELACSNEGTELVKVPCEYTTVECHNCHGQCEWDQEHELEHTCEHCGARWDQDVNAALNLLRVHAGATLPSEAAQ